MSENKVQRSVQSYLRSDAVQQRINALLDKRAPQFTTTLMSVLNQNIMLQECKPESVLSAAITAASMDLPINPNLGFAYIIPYRNKDGGYDAQFQMGYKGFIQLAQRSGDYRTINATDVRKGELKGENKLTGELNFSWIKNEKTRETKPVVGYVAYFKLSNGFEKSSYMTVETLKKHAKKYSKSYQKGYGLWVDDFHSMGLKTVLKLLISKFGPMSTQMQEAILADQSAVEEDTFKYVDNDKNKEDNKDRSNLKDAKNDTAEPN